MVVEREKEREGVQKDNAKNINIQKYSTDK